MPHSTLCSEVLKCIFASVAMALNPASHGEHAGFPFSLGKTSVHGAGAKIFPKYETEIQHGTFYVHVIINFII